MIPLAFAGWGVALPETRVTNDDIAATVDTSDAWILERTGIRERRRAGPNETTATLGTTAASDAIKRAGLSPTDIDLMIVATATPEQPMPHTGAFIGDAIGLRCGSFDLAAACAGFGYVLVVGASMLHMGYRNVLVVGSDTLTRVVDPRDRATLPLFGDGAGAAVITRSAGTAALVGWDLGCDGSVTGILQVPAGGSRLPTSQATVAAGQHFMQMQGQEVFRRAVRAVVSSAQLTLEGAGVTADDVAWFVPHQANTRIIDAAGQRIGIPSERTLVNIERYGNTSAASIPLALFEAVDDGRVREDDLVLLSGFGAGLTWASALVRWGTR